MNRQTIVTALFDLERRGQNTRRSLTSFQEHSTYTLSLDQPLIVYVDPELEDWAWSVRGRERETITRVVPVPFEELTTYGLLPRATSLPCFENADSAGGAPMYQVVNWAKFELLERSIDDDPFSTTHFAWVDIAVAHVANLPEVFPAPVDGVSVLTMRPVAPDEITDRAAFYTYERGRVAGGFMRGSAPRFRRLIEAFWAELGHALACGRRVNEQQVLSYLSCASPELFETYVGDYSSILVNTDLIRDGMQVVMYYLEHCRLYDLWSSAARVHDMIERSLVEGALELGPDEYTRWLSELLAAAQQAEDDARSAAVAHELLGYAGTEQFARDRDVIMDRIRQALSAEHPPARAGRAPRPQEPA